MTGVDVKLVRLSLLELSSIEEQRRLWLSDGRDGREVGSFAEAYCCLFDDSRLGHELDGQGSIYGPAADADFIILDRLLAHVDDRRHPLEVIDDPEMAKIRQVAARLLSRIGN